MAYTRQQQLAAQNYGMTPEQYLANKPWLGVGGEGTVMGGGGSMQSGGSFNVAQPGSGGMNPVGDSGAMNPSSQPPQNSNKPNVGMWSGAANGFNAVQPDNSWFEQIFKRGSEMGSDNMFNNSANRLRERLDSAGAGQRTKATDFNIGRGFGASGAQDRSMYNIDANTQNAYASGLNELANMQQQWQAAGMQGMLGAAQGRAGNEQFFSDQQFRGSENALERALKDMLSSRDNKTSIDLSKITSGNNSIRDIINLLLSGKGV